MTQTEIAFENAQRAYQAAKENPEVAAEQAHQQTMRRRRFSADQTREQREHIKQLFDKYYSNRKEQTQ